MKKLFSLVAVLFLSYTSFALTPILGTLGACAGGTSGLSDTTGGGTWSSSDVAIATVSTSGAVTGISPGTSIITYTEGSSYVTAVFTVTSPTPAAITGTTTICAGTLTTLSDATSGGTWSCTGDATVSTSGVVTGSSSAGTADVYYTMGVGCYAHAGITVNATSAGYISALSSVCSGSTITVTDTTITGGTWSSSNTAIATVDASTGVVTGVSGGTANISYTVTGTCGAASAYRTITVITTSSAGTISGSSTVNTGAPTTLSETVGGGTWSSSNTAIAIVDASSGTVTGISTGAATITYTVSGCSGTVYTTYSITVSTISGISGYVALSHGCSGVYGSFKVWLINYNPSTSMLEALDSITATCSGDSVYYQFLGLSTDSFRVKAAVNNDTMATGYIPTYHTSSFYWHDANVIYHTSGTADIYEDIDLAYGSVTPGPGFIGGNVTTGANRGASGSAPAAGIQMVLETSTGTIEELSTTDASGNYSFTSLPLGSYTIHPELLNYTSVDYTSITLTASSDSMKTTNFIEHTESHTITPGTTSIANVNPTVSSVTAFPNPTSGKLNIQWQETTTENGNVTITDITGREVYKTTINMTAGTGVNQLDLSGLTNGLYIISVKSGDINYNNKIQVQH